MNATDLTLPDLPLKLVNHRFGDTIVKGYSLAQMFSYGTTCFLKGQKSAHPITYKLLESLAEYDLADLPPKETLCEAAGSSLKGYTDTSMLYYGLACFKLGLKSPSLLSILFGKKS